MGTVLLGGCLNRDHREICFWSIECLFIFLQILEVSSSNQMFNKCQKKLFGLYSTDLDREVMGRRSNAFNVREKMSGGLSPAVSDGLEEPYRSTTRAGRRRTKTGSGRSSMSETRTRSSPRARKCRRGNGGKCYGAHRVSSFA
jgi:hypothetical protein